MQYCCSNYCITSKVIACDLLISCLLQVYMQSTASGTSGKLLTLLNSMVQFLNGFGFFRTSICFICFCWMETASKSETHQTKNCFASKTIKQNIVLPQTQSIQFSIRVTRDEEQVKFHFYYKILLFQIIQQLIQQTSCKAQIGTYFVV